MRHSGELTNRPLTSTSDLALTPQRQALIDLVRRYRSRGLPVANGSLLYSNLTSGDDLAFVCSPYRLWEYGSLLERSDLLEGRTTFLDVGGAASPLSYQLASSGMRGLAIDLQPLLVAVCSAAAEDLGLPLRARTQNALDLSGSDLGAYDLVTCISVLEHVLEVDRLPFLRALRGALRRGGLAYLTFDYGPFRRATRSYCSTDAEALTRAIDDISGLVDALRSVGFEPLENDPSFLPPAVLAVRSAPGWPAVRTRQMLALGSVDASTPWRRLAAYALRRSGLRVRPTAGRYAEHTFFRLFLEAR